MATATTSNNMASTTTQFKIQNKDIGDLLLKVQDEIKSLRSMVAKDGSKLDVNLLQSTLLKTENEIKVCIF